MVPPISQDPIGFNAGDANLYRYVGNRVTVSTDPSGLKEASRRIPTDWRGQTKEVVRQGVHGIGQGAMNLLNGLQDSATALGNLGIGIPNKTADLIDWGFGSSPHNRIRVPYIPYSDWSKGLIVHESERCHSTSKFSGAAGAELLSGTWLAKVARARALSALGPRGTPIVLKDGFYEVGNMRISKNYYERLWREGRPAPFIVSREILESGVKGVPDAIKPGFFRYEFGGWEMVYNPVTKEIWHLQPIR